MVAVNKPQLLLHLVLDSPLWTFSPLITPFQILQTLPHVVNNRVRSVILFKTLNLA